MPVPLLVANWKMHGFRSDAEKLLRDIRQGFSPLIKQIEMAICPSFLHLELAKHILQSSPISWGGQNHYLGKQGAFTGEISASMLADLNCRYVILGHSERRQYFHESSELIAQKCLEALSAHLIPVLCVGETHAERESGKAESIIAEQFIPLFNYLKAEDWQSIVIAYEPVWAIGTGLSALPEDANAMHQFIRQFLQSKVDIKSKIRILYGGSVKPDNARALFAMSDIDGALVGGASLHAEHFLQIGYALAEQKKAK